MGFRTDLLTGLGQHAAAAKLGTWNPGGVYTATQTGITIGAVPAAPDRLITLTGYDVTNALRTTDDVQGVQVRCRWGGQDPRPADDLDDALFDLWHDAVGFTLPTDIRVVLMERRSSVSLGQDGNGRWSRASNYYATVHRPSPHRTDD